MTISPPQHIRVMLVDDHAMVRRGLATFLKVVDDLQLVGEAESGEEAIQLCAEVLPDVILMDMVLPMMDGATANHPPVPALDLTEREREVLALMVEGLNNTQIAGRLTVGPSTIKSHVSNILAKLGVTRRTEADTLALRNRMVS